MHIPDGFINGAASAGFGTAAAGSLGIAVRRAGRTLQERQVPLAGLVAAFVFAAQMVNFPVVAGMSGHLLGGVLAAVLVGPWAAFVVMSVVLGTQTLLFSDGGLSALGLNVTNLGLLGAVAGYGLYRLLRPIVPDSARGVGIAAGVAAWASVVLAALGFVAQYAVGGTADISMRALTTAMIGSHALIGIGEGVITALVVGGVMNTRPDLVYGWRRRPSAATTVEG